MTRRSTFTDQSVTYGAIGATLAPDLLRYPPESAGGIMTTEFLSVPSTWTVDEALQLIRRVGGAKETVYAVYVVDPENGR